jgi:hypothetical protein
LWRKLIKLLWTIIFLIGNVFNPATSHRDRQTSGILYPFLL